VSPLFSCLPAWLHPRAVPHPASWTACTQTQTVKVRLSFATARRFVTIVGGGSDAIPYDVKGDTITIHVGGMAGDLVLTRNSDGTLQGPSES